LVQPKVNSAGGMIISFATAENTEASDGDEHSPYALALSKFMKQKMPIETYFRKVGGEVFGSSGQRPMLKSNFYGRFSFGNNKHVIPYAQIEDLNQDIIDLRDSIENMIDSI
jgi:hypothetical protein